MNRPTTWTGPRLLVPPSPHGKRGLAWYLYDRFLGVTSTIDDLQKEEHLSDILRQNSYPVALFFLPASHLAIGDPRGHHGIKKSNSPPLMMLPYTAGVSENIRQVYRRYGKQMIFKSGCSLCSVLSKVKGPLSVEKQYTVGCIQDSPLQLQQGLHW